MVLSSTFHGLNELPSKELWIQTAETSNMWVAFLD